MPVIIMALATFIAVQQPDVSALGDCTKVVPARVWTPVQPAVVERRVEPKWPIVTGKVMGIVLLDVWIDETGRVTCVQVKRSIPILDTAAVTAVREWKFAAARIDGRAVAVVQEIGVKYPPDK